MLKSFMLYDLLGIPEERAVEIAKHTFKTFQGCDGDMLRLCKVVAENYDPEAVLVGVLIEKICSTNDGFHAMDEKKIRRRKFN